MKDFNSKDEVKKLPMTPGVYLMHNEVDEIIYVGKAIHLKNRVSQYFHHNKNRSKKIEQMIASIDWFEYIEVESELEALVLESNLIKKYHPRYNTVMRTDENHPYVKIWTTEHYPRVTLTTENIWDDNLYLGPYYKGMDMENVVLFLNKIYQLRTCKKIFDEESYDHRPCLNYSMGLCEGVCRGNVSEEDYLKRVQGLIHFLKNESEDEYLRFDRKFREEMETAATELEFKKAAALRDRKIELKKIKESLSFYEKEKENNADMIATAENSEQMIVVIYYIRDRKMVARDLFFLQKTAGDYKTLERRLSEFLEEFYDGNPYIPSVLYLTHGVANYKALEKRMSDKRKSKVSCIITADGEYGRLLSLAKESAELILEEYKE